jgi:phosphonate transport system permease protein
LSVSNQHLPDRQLQPLLDSYRAAVSRRRLRAFASGVVFIFCLTLAAWWVHFDPVMLFDKISSFTSYFSRLLRLDDGSFVFTDLVEWFWGWKIWAKPIGGETLLIAYTGTVLGAMFGFIFCFSAASNLSGPRTRWIARRGLEFCRTVPEIVFALIFVLAFGLGPMAGVLALAIHTLGALGKLYTEVVENIDMKPVDGLTSTGSSRAETIAYGVLPQVWPGFASNTLLRFEHNFRGASIMGFVDRAHR